MQPKPSDPPAKCPHCAAFMCLRAITGQCGYTRHPGVAVPLAPREITPEMMTEAAKRVGFDPVPGRLTRLAGVLNAMLADGVAVAHPQQDEGKSR